MPELPEVETIVRDLRPHLVGRTILSAKLSHDDVLRGVTKRKLVSSLAGARVTGMTRRAKHAVIELELPASSRPSRPSRPSRLIIQPGMTGSLTIADESLEPGAARYAVLRAPLDDGRELVYRDVRRLGTILLLDEKGWAAYDAALGPEPLDPGLTPARFAAIMASSKQAIKKVLMDQRKVVGVGNIYANEALFAAGIDPSKPANRLSTVDSGRLLRHVRRILQAAIDSQGTTFRDYRTGTGEKGNFQLELFVYGREGEKCKVCGTRLAHTHEIDARITVFCHRCQQ
jgi:formamidopyrimidine-DNA glycosylase